MAQDVEVKIKIDTSDAQSNISTLDNSVKSLGKTTQTTQEKTKDYAKEIIGNSKLTGALSKATGGLSDAFINAARGVSLTSFSLKGLKAAIISTGVGLLVIAVTELVNVMVEMFDNTKKSAEELEKFTRQLEYTSQAFDDLSVKNKNYYTDMIKLAKANGASQQELDAKQEEYYQNTKKRLDDEIKDKQRSWAETFNNRKLEDADRTKQLDLIKAEETKRQTELKALERDNETFKLDSKINGINKRNELDKTELENTKQAKAQLKALEKKYTDDIQNLDDKTGQAKLTRQKERALKELEEIKLSEKEKAKAKALIIKDFAIKQELFDKEQSDKAKLLTAQFEKDKQDLLAVSDQEKLNLQKERDTKKLEEDLKSIEISETRKEELRLQLQQKYAILQTQLTQKTNQEDAAESQKVLEDIQNSDDTTLEQRQTALEAETAMVQSQFDDKLITEEQYNAKVKFLAEQRKKIGDLEVAWKRAQVGNMGNAFAQLSSLAGESTAAGKAFAVAATTISTYQSAQAAYQSAFMPVATAASPILGGIYAGVAVASGLANIQKILSVKTPGGGGGGGVSAPTPPAQFNVVGASGVNQLSESLNVQNRDADKPLRAFVVSSDVTTQQSMDRQIIRSATLGG